MSMATALPRLLHGPYLPQRVHIGERVHCQLRDCLCVITSWSDARISWPRCRAIGSRGGSGLLLDDQLAHAVRNESAKALGFWWGVSADVVWRWRKLLGIPRAGTEGSRVLIQAAAQLGAAAIKARTWTREEREQQRQRSLALNLGQHLWSGYHGQWWTPEELALLGTSSDEVVAAQIGRTVNAVRVKRQRIEQF